MQEVLSNVLVDVLYLGLITLVPVAIYAVKKGAEALIEYVGIKSDNDAINQVLSEIITFTSDAVSCTMQTYVDSLKNAGKFDKQAQEEAFNRSLETAEQFISQESRELFESVYGDLDEYLRILIEAEVKKLKMKSNNQDNTETTE